MTKRDAPGMSTSFHPFDDLPVVCDPGVAAANHSPAMRPAMRPVTLGELIGAIADEADAVSATESESNALVAATAFGLQWSLRSSEVSVGRSAEEDFERAPSVSGPGSSGTGRAA